MPSGSVKWPLPVTAKPHDVVQPCVCCSDLFHRQIINLQWLTLFYPHRHWHLVWLASYATNCLFSLAADLPYSFSFSMILITACSPMLRPRLLLCFQVMDSITEQLSWGGERKEGRKSLERENSQVAGLLGLWNSSRVPWCSGGLSVHDESTGLLYCLLYFAILYDSHIFWAVLICDQYFIATPGGIFSENTGKKQRPDARTANE